MKTKSFCLILLFLTTLIELSCEKKDENMNDHVITKSMISMGPSWKPEEDSLLRVHWNEFVSTEWVLTGDPRIDILVKKLPTDNWRAALACRNWSTDSTGQTWGTYIPDQYLYLSKKEIRILTAFLLGVPKVTIKEGECPCIGSGNATDDWVTLYDKAYIGGSTGSEKECTKKKDCTCRVKKPNPNKHSGLHHFGKRARCHSSALESFARTWMT